MLDELKKGTKGIGNIIFKNIPASDPRKLPPNAQTVRLSSRSPEGGLIFEGSQIQINTNPEAGWQTGFHNRFGLGAFQNRVLTLIHELGHVADIKTSDGSVQIKLDDDDPDGEISKANNDLVYKNCFAPVAK